CRQGGRSIEVAKYLAYIGFEVVQVTGGMVAWLLVVVVAVFALSGGDRGGSDGPTAAPPPGTGAPVQPPTAADGQQTEEPQAQVPTAGQPTGAPTAAPSSAPPSVTPSASPSGAPSSTTRPPTTTITTTPFGPPTPDRIAQFIQGYYGMLPGNVSGAWSQLAPGYQSQTGGYNSYAAFWSTIRSVQVNGITARGEDGATVALTYVKTNGAVDRENRWIQVRQDGGRMVITASGV
ncbi:serine/threonine protein kinase, partial [Nocardia xishanensis]